MTRISKRTFYSTRKIEQVAFALVNENQLSCSRWLYFEFSYSHTKKLMHEVKICLSMMQDNSVVWFGRGLCDEFLLLKNRWNVNWSADSEANYLKGVANAFTPKAVSSSLIFRRFFKTRRRKMQIWSWFSMHCFILFIHSSNSVSRTMS